MPTRLLNGAWLLWTVVTLVGGAVFAFRATARPMTSASIEVAPFRKSDPGDSLQYRTLELMITAFAAEARGQTR